MSNTPISDTDTPDPWMVPGPNGFFYLTFTAGNRVEIWQSADMQDFRQPQCTRSVVWKPSPGSPWSVDIWAPELHCLDGTWYVYFCGAHPGLGNPSHRTLVLRSSRQDPMDPGGWVFLGPLRGLPDHWNIDATVFWIGNRNRPQTSRNTRRLFCCYSGWPLHDHSDTQQDLFLIELATPEQAIPETLVCISRAELAWERPDGGRRGVNEGPTWLEILGPGDLTNANGNNTNSNSPTGEDFGFTFRGIIYSANGSWTSDYKLGVLQLVDGNADPLQPSSWQKRPTPLLESDRRHGATGPFGPGHASFIVSPPVLSRPTNSRVYCIYHATAKEGEGWNNRKARVLCLTPEHFLPQAQTLCCAGTGVGAAAASMSWTQYPGGMAGHGHPQSQSQRSSGQAAHQRDPSHGKSLMDRIGEKVYKTLKEL
ncbi:hypothetical protein A1O1_04855 [Capronia coronata CBS 617.96]|uniref:Uncharacterized protein n=1 Tax=Capronia coronata CBS 617.96 TaxID=1182541 RepID=W9Y5Y0_9EURO|nr:uncharacterized protein A1O1_04855 [Capronia coronata CBS 617.96]EXJ87928.1 hypothetical protein A1O1_04855 [Capronia coronata CBS 617.96]